MLSRLKVSKTPCLEKSKRRYPLHICFFLFTGSHHRPLLRQHLGNVEKQINKRYGDLKDSAQSQFLDVVRKKNIKQLQDDLAKLLMSIKQGFTHIIAYNKESVKKAVVDALDGKKNPRVYYLSTDGVDKDALIEQFLNQLFFKEGHWRTSAHPCVPYEISAANTTISRHKTVGVLDDDANDDDDNDDDDEDDNMKNRSALCI